MNEPTSIVVCLPQGNSDGTRWQKRLPSARLEMVPDAGHDLLVAEWARTLSYLAPRREAG